MTKNVQKLPSPVTNLESSGELQKEATVEPPEGRPSQITHQSPDESLSQFGFSSPPQDTQAFAASQFVDPDAALSEEVADEAEEGVWGYLLPLDSRYGRCIVLKKRSSCPLPDTVTATKTVKQSDAKSPLPEEAEYEKSKVGGIPAGGYLIGRHPECGKDYCPCSQYANCSKSLTFSLGS